MCVCACAILCVCVCTILCATLPVVAAVAVDVAVVVVVLVCCCMEQYHLHSLSLSLIVRLPMSCSVSLSSCSLQFGPDIEGTRLFKVFNDGMVSVKGPLGPPHYRPATTIAGPGVNVGSILVEVLDNLVVSCTAGFM